MRIRTYYIRSFLNQKQIGIRQFCYNSISPTMNVGEMRKPYKGETEIFDVEHLVSKEPFGQFKSWFEKAAETNGIMEANAMSLATCTKDGKPSVRVVLMKGYDRNGFYFYTNYNSKKAQELEENPRACLNFYWACTAHNETTWSRQVRIEGSVEKIPEKESLAYFQSRPKSSQIGACVSNQSSIIQSREVLTKRKKELEAEYADKEVPKPPHWGGYIVKPQVIEFWQGQTNRLHDRVVFRRLSPGETLDSSITHQGEDGWVYERLAP